MSPDPTPEPKDGLTAIRFVIVGAVCGLAWSTGFRAYMIEIAGAVSRFEWFGTVGAILIPGVVIGALLGWAAAKSALGRDRRVRLLVLSPVLFAIMPMLRPGALADLLTSGLGGGAVGVALIAIGGGYSLSHIGPIWARTACGIIAWGGAVAVAATVPLLGTRRDALTEPRGVWATLLAFSFIAVLIIATSIPLRSPVLVAKAAPPASSGPNGLSQTP